MTATRILSFSANYPPSSLYLTDPSTLTTTFVSGVKQGYFTLAPGSEDFGALPGGRTIFAGIGSDGEDEPWVTDGTAAGTYEITSINPGAYFYVQSQIVGQRVEVIVSGSVPNSFATLNGTQVLFDAGDVNSGFRLWVTDGTATGTTAIANLYPGSTSFVPGKISALGDGRALFTTNGDYALSVTDGTVAGTSVVVTNLSFPINAIVATNGGRALFTTYSSTDNTYELWSTDGTASGTTVVSNDAGGTDLTRLKNGVVIFDRYGQLWRTDGTASSTQQVITLPGGVSNSIVGGFGVLGDGRAEFMVTPSSDPNAEQLWVTDGTAPGTKFVKDFGTDNVYSFFTGGFVSLADGSVAFTAPFSFGLYTSDGTPGGTRPLDAVPTLSPGPLDGAALVDAPFYFAHNHDVAASGLTAASHYLLSGWHEGRDPDALFSTDGYLSTYKDVAAASIDPLAHYDTDGWKEGRDPSASFDTSLYLKLNPDVGAAQIDPLAHYLAYGQAEGRRFLPVIDSAHLQDGLFDPTYYQLANPDVARAGVDALTHYLQFGTDPGRNPNAFFDTAFYLANNPDVAASGLNPMLHYAADGWREGRDPSAQFSTSGYLAANPDVKAAGIDPLLHFLQSGAAEGRLP